MSESEFLELAWSSCINRVAKMIEEYSDGWVPNGPCAVTAEAIKNKVLAMPMPQTTSGEPR